MEVNNMHVRLLADKLARFTFEIIKSQSSASSTFIEADAKRLTSYLDAIDTAHAWIISLPQLDLPKSTPISITVEDFPESVDTNSEIVNMIQDILDRSWTELVKGQSSLMGSGLIKQDSTRLTDIIEHCRKFLNDYVVPIQPIDQPESTPMEPSTGQGNVAA